MGITVHWAGEVDDKDIAFKVITYAKFMADVLGWKVSLISESGYVIEEIVKTEKKNFSFWHFVEKKYADRYGYGYRKRSVKFGILIDPNVKGNINTEDIEISFYSFGKKYVMDGFTKTQVFNESEEGNLIVHSILVLMLLTIKNTWIPNLDINDEGEYYVPMDSKEREEWLQGFIEEYRDTAKSLRPFNYEHLMEEHSNLSLMIGSLKSLLEGLVGEENVVTPSKKPYDSGR
ncbi:MAG: hypothetical protein ACP5T9_03100 [Thermoplasmata archaeon]